MCDNGEHCVNTVGSFMCEEEDDGEDDECGAGFRFYLVTCIDINECQESEPCSDGEVCVNTEGGYQCQPEQAFNQDNPCPVGFQVSRGWN